MRGHADLILVFINILCHTNQDGICDRHWRAIVDETGLPEERVRKAIEELESPDTDSRTPVDNGRRLQRIEETRTWGWQVVNFEKYRALHSAEGYREYMRDYMRKSREKPDVNNKLKQNIKSRVSVSDSSPKGGCKGGGFDRFWQAYPRKAGKKAALKAWRAANDKPDIEAIIKAVQAQGKSEQWQKEGGQYIPMPTTWLNQGRWADEAQTAPKSKPSAIRESRDIILGRAIDALEHASEHGTEAVDRCVEGLRDKFRDYGKNREGKTVVAEALEVWKGRERG